MHFTYADPSTNPDLGLRQGDILKISSEIEALLKRYHPHYVSNPDNKFFIVLTQSCDLVRRGSEGLCAARYITIAPVRQLSLVITRLITEERICADISDVPICTYRSRNQIHSFLERLFNNNAQDYFYLHAEPSKGIAKDYCAFLRLPIALRANEHYDKFLNSRIIGLDETFQSKLGWLVGQLFSRVGTQDWEKKALSENTKLALKRNIVWIDEKQQKQYSELLSNWSSDNPGIKANTETIGTLAKQVKKKKEIVLSKIEELMLRNHLPALDVRNIIKVIESDPEISASLK